jgi:hypothetical protein
MARVVETEVTGPQAVMELNANNCLLRCSDVSEEHAGCMFKAEGLRSSELSCYTVCLAWLDSKTALKMYTETNSMV